MKANALIRVCHWCHPDAPAGVTSAPCEFHMWLWTFNLLLMSEWIDWERDTVEVSS